MKLKNRNLLREKQRNNNNNKLNELRNNLNKYSTDTTNLSNKYNELIESNKLISKYIHLENGLIISETYSLPTDESGNEYPFNNQLQFQLESEVMCFPYWKV